MSGTLHEDLNTIYFCRLHKFIINNLFLCNIKYFYIVYSDMYLKDTHRTHCCVSTATIVTRTCYNVTLYVYYLSCFKVNF
jgi:hypothetical protein